ncbi:hypothetical protein EV421DRAFT_1740215 [Armillaria borealis]|uniref:Uncharacterized protein n=1 Tax=Armillaria borealis TaxID=47425 RepID=A0AA39J697_9AGAR|nr:hypothetical protein EV421DRAFT_1740215 [Armillaria borealis]
MFLSANTTPTSTHSDKRCRVEAWKNVSILASKNEGTNDVPGRLKSRQRRSNFTFSDFALWVQAITEWTTSAYIDAEEMKKSRERISQAGDLHVLSLKLPKLDSLPTELSALQEAVRFRTKALCPDLQKALREDKGHARTTHSVAIQQFNGNVFSAQIAYMHIEFSSSDQATHGRAVEQKKIVMPRGIRLFMDIGTKDGRDRDAYGSRLPAFLPSTTTTEIIASNSYHAENDLNKHYLRRPLLPPMEKAALGARTRYSPII